LAIFQVCYGQKCLTLPNEGPKKNAECKFPWYSNGKLLQGCTTDLIQMEDIGVQQNLMTVFIQREDSGATVGQTAHH